MENKKLVYTRKEGAAAITVSLRKMDDLIATKQIRVKRVGRRVVIPARELERYLNSAA